MIKYVYPINRYKPSEVLYDLASIFKTNQTQAVRLPKAVAFPQTVKQVEVKVVGNTRILSPVGSGWDFFFDHVEVPDDFD